MARLTRAAIIALWRVKGIGQIDKTGGAEGCCGARRIEDRKIVRKLTAAESLLEPDSLGTLDGLDVVESLSTLESVEADDSLSSLTKRSWYTVWRVVRCLAGQSASPSPRSWPAQ